MTKAEYDALVVETQVELLKSIKVLSERSTNKSLSNGTMSYLTNAARELAAAYADIKPYPTYNNGGYVTTFNA